MSCLIIVKIFDLILPASGYADEMDENKLKKDLHSDCALL